MNFMWIELPDSTVTHLLAGPFGFTLCGLMCDGGEAYGDAGIAPPGACADCVRVRDESRADAVETFTQIFSMKDDDTITVTVRGPVVLTSETHVLAVAKGIEVTFLGRQPDCERHTLGEPHAPCWKFSRRCADTPA